MKRQLMAEQWNEFSLSALPAGCSTIQRREIRRVFYAGAQSILFRVIQSFAPESEPTEADLQIMEDLLQELNEFAAAVEAGRS